MNSLPIAPPPLAEQQEIVKVATVGMGVDRPMREATTDTQERLARLDSSILAKAFRGELVPQDPNDEPASELLERIRAEREKAAPKMVLNYS